MFQRQQHIDRRRLLILAGGQVATLALLAACGGGVTTATPSVTATSTATTSSAAAIPKNKGITITYWDAFSGTNGKAIQEIVKQFNTSQTGVNVNYQFQGTYEDVAHKVATALAAHQAPDVAILSDVWWTVYYLDDSILAFDSFLAKANVNPKAYVDSFYNEGVKNGKNYWLPFARSTPLFYYNTEVFKAAGVEPIKTWDDLVHNGSKLMGKSPSGADRYAFANANGNSYIAWVFQPVNWAFGGEYSDANFKMHFTDPDTIAAGQLFSDLVNKYKIANNPNDIGAAFTNGLTASALMSTASLAGLEATAKFQIGTSFLPTEKQFGCCTGGAGMSIFKTSANRDAAFQWTEFATNETSTIYWSQNTGYMPVLKSALTSSKMTDFYTKHPNFKTAVDQLAKTRPQDLARVAIPNGDQIIGDGLQRLVLKNDPVATVFGDLQTNLTQKARPIIAKLQARAKQG